MSILLNTLQIKSFVSEQLDSILAVTELNDAKMPTCVVFWDTFSFIQFEDVLGG